MRVNEIIIASKSSRLTALLLLLVVLFALSIMYLPSCSDDNGSPQRVVQATVYFEDEGPVAMASIQDGDKNLVSDVIITINDRPLELHFLGGELSDGVEGNVPYFYLEMPDLKGGDMLTLVVRRSDGRLIYAPPSAQIPMPIELIEPSPDQKIVPGEEMVVRWVGGEGATHIEALYGPDEGGDSYLVIRRYADVLQLTVPPGIIKEGGGIIAAAAMTGEHPSFDSGSSDDAFVSSFVVTRYTGGHWEVTPDIAAAGRLAQDSKKSDNGCPNSGTHACKGAAKICLVSTPLFAPMWAERCRIDATNHQPCHIQMCVLTYCAAWMSCFSVNPFYWVEGCMCPYPPKQLTNCCND